MHWSSRAHIIVLEFMEVFAGSDDVISGAVAPHDPTLPLQGSFNERLSAPMVHIRELYLVYRPGWCTRVDKNVGVSFYEAIPLEIKWEALSGSCQKLLASRR